MVLALRLKLAADSAPATAKPVPAN